MNTSPLKKALNYVSKLISTALLIVLVIVGLFLVYYLISAKMVAKDPRFEPKINLYTIVSGSMEPNIKVYDVVVDFKVNNPEDLKIGDVITFKSTSNISKDLIVTHRIIDTRIVNGKVEYVTKGDFNSSSDPDTAKFDNIIGKVVIRFPQLGRIQFFLATKMGWFLVVLLPAMCVIIYDIIKLIKLLALKKNGDNIQPTKSSGNIHINVENVDIKEDNKEEIIDNKHNQLLSNKDEIKKDKKENSFNKNKNNNKENYIANNKSNKRNNNNQNSNNNINNNKSNNNLKIKNNKQKNVKNDNYNNQKIINDTLENIKKSNYKARLNNLKDYEKEDRK